jgi:predicted MFS family arabinose efflux permease
LGGIVGTLSLGLAGDQWGRFPSLYAANAILLVSGLALPLCTTFGSYCFVRFLSGMSYDSALQFIYLLCKYFLCFCEHFVYYFITIFTYYLQL